MMVVALGALAACGLNVLATGDRPDPDAGSDATTTDAAGRDAPGDAPSGDGSQIVLPPVPDPFLDAGLDANQANCLAGCDGGTCDAGWCVLDCATAGTCTNDRVVCPPGIPCEVDCKGQGSCAQGVDCTAASACRIDCSGLGSCINQPVECSGLACKIDCLGNGSCTKGVSCDAGTCAIACLGDGTCTNAPVTCNANTCTVRCGVAGDVGKDSCSKGVTCDTTQLCDIGCVAHNVCKNEPIAARSDGTSIVQCTGQTSCNKNVVLGGAEAGVLCSGSGSCADKAFCDAGKCAATCVNENITLCCKNGVVCDRTKKNCQIDSMGCP